MCARRLFFHRGIDLVGDFVQPRGCPRDLRGTVRLLVGGRADLLRKLVNLGDDVRDLAQRSVEVLAQA